MTPRDQSVRQRQLREAGLFLVVVGLPLIFAPFAALSFATPKLVFLLLGAVLIALSGPQVERRLTLAASAWIGALLVSSLFGLDPWWSIVGAEYQNTGVIAFGSAALLLCVGAELEAPLRHRVPYWLLWTGAVVAAVAVVARFVEFRGPTWRLSWHSSTIGHRVFVGGFLAVAVLAATRIDRKPHHYVALLVVGSGLAVSAVRSAWIGLALGLAFMLVVHRDLLRNALLTLMPVMLSLLIWTVASSSLASRAPPVQDVGFSPVQRFGELDEGSAAQRPAAYRAYLRGWKHDPWIGSGPGTGWHVYLTNGTPAELRAGGRGFADAHNIVLELGATTGLLGILPLLLLAALAFPRLRRTSGDQVWAIGAALALGTVLSLQPIHIVAMPLMFLSVGLAMNPAPAPRLIRIRWPVTALLLFALLLASARLLASSLEQYGRSYASDAAYRYALRLEPRRVGAVLALASHRALDHRMGESGAADDAGRLVRRAVREHRWHPHVRLAGANVMVLLDDFGKAQRLLDEHLQIFPNDGAAIAAAANLALQRGDIDAARRLAERALRIFPDLARAQRVIDALDAQNSSNQAEVSSEPP